MRVVFICGCLEEGIDGVGDYLRHLAFQLVLLGHKVELVALNDSHIGDQIIQNPDLPYPITRFGNQVSWLRRMQFAIKKLHEFSPDWISLQYVSFSFNHKGMPFFLPRRLSRLSKAGNWHVMFHELWNGGNRNAKLSHHLLGFFEKRIVFGLLNKLKPRLCTTTNHLYNQWLNSEKIDNHILPLFSNIRSHDVKENYKSETENAVAIFGQLESEELGRELISAAIKMAGGRSLEWRVLGLAGPKWEKVLQEKGISFYRSGKLKEEDLSFALSSCRFGLASTNIYRIGKSSSALVMLENGLPLLVGRSGWVPLHKFIHSELPDGCLECRANPCWDNLPNNNQFKKPPSPHEIAQRFVSLLKVA